GGVEDLLLGRRVQFEERSQSAPHRGQHPGISAVDLLQDREQPPLLMMVVKDQLGNVHSSSPGAVSLGWHARQKPTITHGEGGPCRTFGPGVELPARDAELLTLDVELLAIC